MELDYFCPSVGYLLVGWHNFHSNRMIFIVHQVLKYLLRWISFVLNSCYKVRVRFSTILILADWLGTRCTVAAFSVQYPNQHCGWLPAPIATKNNVHHVLDIDGREIGRYLKLVLVERAGHEPLQDGDWVSQVPPNASFTLNTAAAIVNDFSTVAKVFKICAGKRLMPLIDRKNLSTLQTSFAESLMNRRKTTASSADVFRRSFFTTTRPKRLAVRSQISYWSLSVSDIIFKIISSVLAFFLCDSLLSSFPLLDCGMWT